ncbi:MAG: class I SAM-dependent methyltransferase [Candidatus Paceibacterota bacterium]|jgi:ubiquinone/menaquinone biosynthesis C-methylase UbiE
MFADPESNVRQFGLEHNMYVADLGAGTGAYSIAAAHMVMGGRVYAIEVQKDLLEKIRTEAVKQHLSNIECIWGNIENPKGTKLRDHAVDAVIASNVLFQVEDRDGFIKEIKRILKPEGKVLIIDWSDSFGGMGPKGDSVISESKAKELFEKHGFTFDKDISTGAHHYGMILKKT